MSCVVKEWLPVAKVQEEYKKKLVTADEAVKVVKSGDYLHYGLFTGVVVDLDTALAKRTQELEDVTICTTMWSYAEPPAVLQADPKAEHFHYASSHFTPIERKCNKAGNCWFLPVQFRENTKFYEECRPTFDVCDAAGRADGQVRKLQSRTAGSGILGHPQKLQEDHRRSQREHDRQPRI